MLDLRRLTVFREVARSGSFSAAADRLDYSQPAVSHHVARLELELGATLLLRHPRGLELTDVGREVLRHADAILANAGDAEVAIQAMVAVQPERVRLGGFQTSTGAVIAPALRAFWAEYPSTRVTLLEADPVEHIESLRSGQLDLAIVFDHPEGPIAVDDRIEISYLHDDPMLVVVPAGHPAARLHAIPLASLRDASWLEGAGPEATSSIFLRRACAPLGFAPDVAFACGNYDAVQGMIAAGMGVALVPELALREAVAGVVVRPPADAAPVRRIGLASVRDRHRPPHFAAMERALAAAFAARRRPPGALTAR